MKEKIKEWIFSVIGLTAGAALAAAALENFLIPFRILDGGLNGIGMIINFLTDIPLSILIVILISRFLSSDLFSSEEISSLNMLMRSSSFPYFWNSSRR